MNCNKNKKQAFGLTQGHVRAYVKKKNDDARAAGTWSIDHLKPWQTNCQPFLDVPSTRATDKTHSKFRITVDFR